MTVEAVALNVRFPGQYADAETGLRYNYLRDYNPSTGRYIIPDPIGFEGGLNIYLYANANPLLYIDPDALQAAALALPGLGAEGAAGAAATSGLLGPGAAAVGAGLAGYGLGSLIYPHIAVPLGNAIDFICRSDPDDLEDECDRRYYEVDIPVCRGIARTRGKEAARRCYASANERYAACLAGRPIPPLDTWNN